MKDKWTVILIVAGIALAVLWGYYFARITRVSLSNWDYHLQTVHPDVAFY
jgi:hypothetical protein